MTLTIRRWLTLIAILVTLLVASILILIGQTNATPLRIQMAEEAASGRSLV
ncbi:hypothetical protein GWK36_12375 [Caldichromatium japonicum]|uniref:Uncharacterized protein n=1 Tax=Caldichromatium japonicum TaxID=2699430 RepID=A0A6G7VFJ8_9GAMM|nr:hypothetical protein [Caldichromatium japonicum]QIK38645.1 hypothetical protein GWK36_12375 [Caldichromatium japonicum]